MQDITAADMTIKPPEDVCILSILQQHSISEQRRLQHPFAILEYSDNLSYTYPSSSSPPPAMKTVYYGPPRSHGAVIDCADRAPVTTWGGLPSPALDVIADCLDTEDLASLAAVSRHWKDAAERLMWRDLKVSFGEASETRRLTQTGLAELVRVLEGRPWVAEFIQSLRIDVSDTCPANLVKLLPLMPLLRTLEMRPTHGFGNHPGWIPLCDILDRLDPLPTVTKLELVLEDGKTKWTRAFCRALEVMPNLTELSLRPAYEYADGWGNHTVLELADITKTMPTLDHLVKLDVAEMHACLEGPIQQLVEKSKASKVEVFMWDPTGPYDASPKFQAFLDKYGYRVTNDFRWRPYW